MTRIYAEGGRLICVCQPNQRKIKNIPADGTDIRREVLRISVYPGGYKDLVFAFRSDFNGSVFAFFAVSLYGTFSFEHSHSIDFIGVELA